MVGVHTPEFGVEHDLDNVRWAGGDFGIDYAVVLDNDYAIWNHSQTSTGPRSTSPMRRDTSDITTSAKVRTKNRNRSSAHC